MTTTTTTTDSVQDIAENLNLTDLQVGLSQGLYAYADRHSTMIELTDRGVEVAEEAGLRVDVDCYGCAYVAGVETR